GADEKCRLDQFQLVEMEQLLLDHPVHPGVESPLVGRCQCRGSLGTKRGIRLGGCDASPEVFLHPKLPEARTLENGVAVTTIEEEQRPLAFGGDVVGVRVYQEIG